MSQLNQFRFIDTIRTLTGDAGGAISPDAIGNLNILGGTGLSTTGVGNTLTINADASVATSYLTDDANSAVPALNVLTVAGGTNLGTTSAGSTVTINLDDIITLTTVNAANFFTSNAAAGLSIYDSTILADGTDANIDINITPKGTGQIFMHDLNITGLADGILRCDTGSISSVADGADGTLLIGKTGDVPIWATLTDGNNITCTEGANSISIAVTGTTDNALQVGNATGSLSSLAVGTDGTVLVGNTAADPSFSANPILTTVYATTFDTNVAAAAVTLSGTTLSADGTDADININITAKGTGQVIIDDLQLTTDLAVTEGGTGVSTLTDHGVLVGSGAGAITALAVGATGEILIGNTTADPSWSASPTVTTMYAGTFATTAVAAGLTITGNTVTGSGTDTNIDLNIAPKGTGTVLIPSVRITGLSAGLAVSNATGVISSSSTTQYALQVGNATSTVSSLGIGSSGQVLQSSGAGVNPAWSTVTYPSTAAIGTILIASAANTITTLAPDTAGYVLTDGGAGVAPSWQAASAGTVTSVTGGTNITDSGTATDPVMDLDSTLITMDSVTFNTGGSLQTGTTATNSLLLQAYDVDGTAYVPFMTLTAADTPTCDLSTDVTIGTKYIYRADGTDVAVSDGGTGASTLTDHGLLLGSGTSAVTSLAEATNGQIPIGSTGNDCVLATITASTGMTVTNAAGSITLSSTGTTLNDQTGTTYTLVLSDSGKMITCTNASDITVTVPTNAAVAFPIGTTIGFFQGGAGQITLSGAVPPTLKSADNAYTTVKLYSACGITKIESDVWMVYGDVEA